MLVGVPAPVDLHVGPGVDLDQRDLALLAALREDGRRTFEELGRIIGISDVTARRRVEALRASGILQLRAVFDPGLIGKDAEYILVCRTHPSQVAALSAELRADDSIKYAVRIAGPWQFLIKVDLAHRNSLDEFLAAAPWAGRITDGDTFIAIHTDKRNAVLLS
nr:AsnC family transcriptional regulator [Brevibacterium sp. 68QC2CO]